MSSDQLLPTRSDAPAARAARSGPSARVAAQAEANVDAGTDADAATGLRARLEAEHLRSQSLQQQLQASEARLTTLRAALADSERQSAAQSAHLVRLQAQIDDLPRRVELALAAERQARLAAEQVVAQYEAQYRHLLASSSWRLTQPVRWVGLQLRRARRTVRLLPYAAARHGGYPGAARQALAVWRGAGLPGLRRLAQVIEQEAGGGSPPSFPPSRPPAESQPAALAPTASMPAFEAPPRDYAEWVRLYDSVDDALRARLRRRVQALPARPLISIVMPTYSANPLWLDAAIESVRAQIYPHWELCIADDASPDPAARQRLRDWAAREPRIRLVFRERNGHISAASNSALERAQGEWVALMDHDDLLPEHALFWVADAIVRHPEARLIYSDEDKLDLDGRRAGPYFKPDWNIDLFYSQNFFSHLGVYHAALLREVGGFREGFEGSQDYDLVLRCIERLRPGQIHHIPRVLYHWRVHPQSTASSTDAKPYAQIAGERALNEHLERMGVSGRIEYIGYGYRAHYRLPEPLPLVSLIIPTRNAAQLVRQCINSILARTTYTNYEIILVDNGSDEPESLEYFQLLARQPGFTVLRDDGEFNFSALNNRAVAVARGEIVGLINNDIEVISPDWLFEMVSLAVQPGVGAVGAKLWYPDKTLQHGGVVLGVGGVASHAHKGWTDAHTGYFGRAALIQSFSAVTAACLLVGKRHYEAVGGLNEQELKVAFNDVDFCLRLREAGLRNVWTPYAELFHHESATRGQDLSPERQARFNREVRYMLERWNGLLQNDPAYNPNLTLGADDFSLAWPPRPAPDETQS